MTRTTSTSDVDNHDIDPIDVQVGFNIRQIRKAQGLSQTALADALGVSFQQVQKYERGSNRVSASALWRVARFLKVTPGALFESADTAGDPQVEFLPSKFREAISQTYVDETVLKMGGLPVEQRRHIRDLAAMLAGDTRA